VKLTSALAALSAVFATSVAAAETGSIATVNAPLAYFARVLGDPEIEVIYAIPEDVDPAYWSPTPDEVLMYRQADLILMNGAGYAAWVKTEVLPRAPRRYDPKC
jgi:zinc transport system substrate-binding protein